MSLDQGRHNHRYRILEYGAVAKLPAGEVKGMVERQFLDGVDTETGGLLLGGVEKSRQDPEVGLVTREEDYLDQAWNKGGN